VALSGHLGAYELEWTQQNPIDLELCVRCNACVKACPEAAIGWDLQVDVDACRSHRACVAACGEIGAIDFARADVVRRERFDLVLDLSTEPLLKRVELPDGYAAPGRDPFEQALAVQALASSSASSRSRATWPSRPACARTAGPRRPAARTASRPVPPGDP